MTKDEIIKTAKELGAVEQSPYDYGAQPDSMIISFDVLERLVNQAITKEREACALLSEGFDRERPETNYGRCIAHSIRLRSRHDKR